MPLNFNPATISPDAIRRLLMQGGDAATMFNGDPSQPQPSPATTAPPSGTISQAMPQGMPATQSQPLSSVTPGSEGAQSAPQPSADPFKDYVAQHGHAPIEGAPPAVPDHGTLYKIFNTIGRVVGSPLAERAYNRDWNLKQQNIGYQRQQPVMQEQADRTAYDKSLSEQKTSADTRLTTAEAGAAEQQLPLAEQAEKEYNGLVQTWQNKEQPDFDGYAKAKLTSLPPAIARRISPLLSQIKQLPQTGKGYKINMQDDLPTSINMYGKDYSRTDPELLKQPGGQEAGADFDRAQAAHTTKRSEKLQDENTTAGFAANRQAQAFSNQQQMEATKKMQPAVDTALTADDRLARMEKSYTKGVAGDQQAQLALLADHLGMTFGMQKGAKLNRGLIEEAQQSQPWLAKIGAKFDDKGYLSGVALGSEQMKQMLDLGYDARDRAWQGAHNSATTYGVPLPPGAEKVEQQRKPGSKPLLQQQGGQGSAQQKTATPQGATHIGVSSLDGKKYYLDAQGKKLGPAE